MNCPETELTKSCIFLSAVLISVLGFLRQFLDFIGNIRFKPKGINSLVEKEVGDS